MRFCEECGAKIEDDSLLFCDECGARLEPVETESETAVPSIKPQAAVPVQQPAPQNPQATVPVQQPAPQQAAAKKSKFPLIPVIIGAVALVAVIVVVIILTSGNKDTGKKTPDPESDNTGKINITDKTTQTPKPDQDSVKVTATPTPEPTKAPTPTPEPTPTPLPTVTPTPDTGASYDDFFYNTTINDAQYYDYLIWESGVRELTEEDLYGLNEFECKLARNEIFARYGRKFANADLQQYFNSKSWYYGYIEPGDFNESILTSVERSNVNFIKAFEDNKRYEIYQNYSRHIPDKVLRFYASIDYELSTETIDIEFVFDTYDTGTVWIHIYSGPEEMLYGYYFRMENDLSFTLYYNDFRSYFRSGTIVKTGENGQNPYSIIFNGESFYDEISSWEDYQIPLLH